MASRLKLHSILKGIVKNVYYQPPESLKLEYPCIVYHQTMPDVKKANDGVYSVTKHYQLTLIHKDPDNMIVDELIKLPLCKMANPFTQNGFYHYPFDIYY